MKESNDGCHRLIVEYDLLIECDHLKLESMLIPSFNNSKQIDKIQDY